MSAGINSRSQAVYFDESDRKWKTRISSDGEAIPVTFTAGTPIVEYAGISSLASGTLTTILSYTVPVGKTLTLEKIEVSGCNVADYSVDIAAVVKGKRRSYYGNFNADFEYKGLQVLASTIIRVRVIHSSSLSGDFDATLIGSLL